MSGFIKLSRNEKVEWTLLNHPNAFLLLTLIAWRARFYPDHPDGLKPGECHIGDHTSCGLSRQQYRTALQYLVKSSTIEILETCRTRKKSTTGTTTKGTKVRLIDTSIYDINITCHNHQTNHCPTTDQPPTNHEQRNQESKKIDKDQRFSKIHSSELNGVHEQFGISEGYAINIVQVTISYLQSQDMEIGSPNAFLRKCFASTQANYELAKTFEGKQTDVGHIHCGPKHLEFVWNANCSPTCLAYTDKEFSHQAKETALRMGVRL